MAFPSIWYALAPNLPLLKLGLVDAYTLCSHAFAFVHRMLAPCIVNPLATIVIIVSGESMTPCAGPGAGFVLDISQFQEQGG